MKSAEPSRNTATNGIRFKGQSKLVRGGPDPIIPTTSALVPNPSPYLWVQSREQIIEKHSLQIGKLKEIQEGWNEEYELVVIKDDTGKMMKYVTNGFGSLVKIF